VSPKEILLCILKRNFRYVNILFRPCPPSLLNAEIGGGEDIWDWEGVVEQRWQDLLTPIAP
jgi:hypothetical protein